LRPAKQQRIEETNQRPAAGRLPCGRRNNNAKNKTNKRPAASDAGEQELNHEPTRV